MIDNQITQHRKLYERNKSDTSNLQIFQHVNFPFLVCFMRLPTVIARSFFETLSLGQDDYSTQSHRAQLGQLWPQWPRWPQGHRWPQDTPDTRISIITAFPSKPSKWHMLMNLQTFYCKRCILRILAPASFHGSLLSLATTSVPQVDLPAFRCFFFTTCRGTKHQIVLCSPWVFPNKGCQSGGPLKTPHNQLGFFRMSTWSLYFLPSSYQYWPITITVCVDFQSLIRLGE